MASIRIQRTFRERLERRALYGVPRSVAKLFFGQKDTWIDAGRHAEMGLPLLLSQIASIMQEKVHSDEKSRNRNRDPTALPAFAYDFFLQRYGNRAMAERATHDMYDGMRHHVGGQLRVRLFALFCGIRKGIGGLEPEEIDMLQSPEAIEFYLGCLRIISKHITRAAHGKAQAALLFPCTDHDDSGRSRAPRVVLVETAREIFAPMMDEHKNRVLDEVRTLGLKKKEGETKAAEGEGEGEGGSGDAAAAAVPSEAAPEAPAQPPTTTTQAAEGEEPDDGLVDVDNFLWMAMHEWYNELERREERMKAMLVANDTDMDNVISFDEFTSLMRQAKPDEEYSAAELTRMYREAAQLSEPGDTLEHDEFMAVAKSWA